MLESELLANVSDFPETTELQLQWRQLYNYHNNNTSESITHTWHRIFYSMDTGIIIVDHF